MSQRSMEQSVMKIRKEENYFWKIDSYKTFQYNRGDLHQRRIMLLCRNVLFIDWELKEEFNIPKKSIAKTIITVGWP